MSHQKKAWLVLNLLIFWLICLICPISTLLSSLIQPFVGLIEPFLCRVTYIQPYCASECINMGFTMLKVQPFYASEIVITLFQHSDLAKYSSFNPFNPVAGWGNLTLLESVRSFPQLCVNEHRLSMHKLPKFSKITVMPTNMTLMVALHAIARSQTLERATLPFTWLGSCPDCFIMT